MKTEAWPIYMLSVSAMAQLHTLNVPGKFDHEHSQVSSFIFQNNVINAVKPSNLTHIEPCHCTLTHVAQLGLIKPFDKHNNMAYIMFLRKVYTTIFFLLSGTLRGVVPILTRAISTLN